VVRVATSTAAVATALVGLCVLDAALVGYRAVCGRSAFVQRAVLDRRAGMVGAGVGVAVVIALGVWFGVVLAAADDPATALEALASAGGRMLVAYGAFTVVTVAALGVFWVAPPRWGSLAMVTILGPLTLLRPLILLVGSAAAVAGAGTWWPIALASVTVVLVAVALETALLERWGARAALDYRPPPAI